MHYLTFIVIPSAIYSKGEKEIEQYIEKTMMPYWIDLDDPHIEHTKANLDVLFEQQSEYKDIKDYVEDEGWTLDEKGNAIATFNRKGEWDYYRIGGRWNNVVKTGSYKEGEGKLIDNMVKVSEYASIIEPAIVVDENGTFLKDDDVHFNTIRERNRDNYFVGLDLHN